MAGSRLNPVLFSPSYPSSHKQQDRSSRPPSTQSSALMRLSPLPRNRNPVTRRCTSVLSATQQCSVSDLTGQRCCLHIKHRVQIPAASWHTNRPESEVHKKIQEEIFTRRLWTSDTLQHKQNMSENYWQQFWE